MPNKKAVQDSLKRSLSGLKANPCLSEQIMNEPKEHYSSKKKIKGATIISCVLLGMMITIMAVGLITAREPLGFLRWISEARTSIPEDIQHVAEQIILPPTESLPDTRFKETDQLNVLKSLQVLIPFCGVQEVNYEDTGDMPAQSGNHYHVKLGLYVNPEQCNSATFFSPPIPLADAIDSAFGYLHNILGMSLLEPDHLQIAFSSLKPNEDDYKGSYYQFIFLIKDESREDGLELWSIYISAETGEVLGLPLMMNRSAQFEDKV